MIDRNTHIYLMQLLIFFIGLMLQWSWVPVNKDIRIIGLSVALLFVCLEIKDVIYSIITDKKL